jgi:hypothetical protein
MGEVIHLHVSTTADIPPERVLAAAGEAGLTSVMVLGWTDDGQLYIASSGGAAADMLWTLELSKKTLLDSAIA